MISSVTQTFRDQTCISLVCFDTLSPLRQHSCRSKDDTFDPGLGQLIVQGISQTPCLVTAFKRICIIRTEFLFQGFYERNDCFVVRGGLYLPEDPVFRSDCRLHCTKSVIAAMDIHTDFDYSIHR